MTHTLSAVCCARLPAAALPALATLRCRPDIKAVLAGEHIWLHWHTAEDVLRLLLPIPGVELFYMSDGLWYRAGQRLPVEPPPAEPAQRLDQLLVPDRIPVEEAPPPSHEPVRLALARDGRPRQATALVASIEALRRWAETATSRALAGLKAARYGERVLVLGAKLPLLEDGERLWGQRILVPLGFRMEPALPESVLAEVIGLHGDEIALLGSRPDSVRIDIIADDAFVTLSRAAIRLATAEVRP